jgi:DNA-binding response OmpR family regulator
MNLLLVEDDKETREFLQYALRREGFVVDAAADGETGCRKAKAGDYDLVMMDYMLPEKNGRDVCRELRVSGKTMPILMLSVRDDATSKVELLTTGADDYVVKPFSYAEVLARIRALLRRPSTLQNDVFSVDNLVLDSRGRRVTRGDRTIHLTPKEFFLLEYLMRNKGTVMSRMAILEHVWDVNADPFTNTIETHILNIRKKVAGKGERELIRSVSGTGYVIE